MVKNRQLRKNLILICLAAIFILLLAGSVYRHLEKKNWEKDISALPAFCLPQAMDSVLFCHSQIAGNAPVVILYLHPDCDLCQSEAAFLREKISLFGNSQLLMISHAGREELSRFVTDYGLDRLPSLKILTDPDIEMYTRLKVNRIPACFVYDDKHQFVTSFQGIVRLDMVIELIR